MTLTKAAKTTQYIIETVAPYFNKHGYTGTSLSDITKATGLTKGAIYGNFENKEDLAIQAFNYTVKTRLWPVIETINAQNTGLKKLKALTNFYRNYYDHVSEYGGCPVLNVGVDSLNHNNALYNRVVSVIQKMTQGIIDVIEQAQQEGSIKSNLDASSYAKKIYAQIQGSVFLAIISKSNENMQSMMDHIDQMIDQEMRI
ncbi:TetR/AcrR family transcriptional regulator [Reichenbachiella agarivorans]|uniref:TetR/AcrR family transcriptional regulator n=1 Tax=Reichenbachiella agarivorans TaxID=2979464 RepID=A0ABY6CNY4_9BACT|nr:TetR/AcrR family transcriptional regulator [Reichenbachiella agarivorans]UXP32225.1 TetR/AcrR family transcriptional regulator [Reichenbachiella agarivorans]